MVEQVEAINQETITEDEEVAGFFGPDAIIERTVNGYRVSTDLQDGVTEGGQGLQMEIGPRVDLEKTVAGYGDLVGYPLRKLKINGADYPLVSPQKTFLVSGLAIERSVPAPEDPEERLVHDFKMSFVGTTASLEDGTIAVSHFRTGDDLVTLIHEEASFLLMAEGVNSSDLRKRYYEMMILRGMARYFSAFDTAGAARLEYPSSEDVELYLAILKDESDADKKALTRIVNLKTENDITLFPNDPNLLRAKKLLVTALSFGYMQIDPELRKAAGKRADELLNL